MRKRLLSILMLIGMLVLLIGPMALPASALGGNVTQQRFPTPAAFVLNNGSQFEQFWWESTFTSGPVLMSHGVYFPNGTLAGSVETWDITGRSSPIYNPEDSNAVAHPGYGLSADADGAHQTPAADGNPAFSHNWTVPAGSPPGTYTSRVRFYSEDVLQGEQPNDSNWEAESAVTFFVQQPWQLFKYHDLNGNGSQDPGEPGLDGWHFTVTGPAGSGYAAAGDTSGGGFLVLPNATEAGAYTITETLLANWVNTDPGDNTPPITKIVNIPGDLNPADPTVKFGNMQLEPNTVVGISASISPLVLPPGGGTVNLILTEENTGDVDLFSVNVTLLTNGGNPIILGYPGLPPNSGDNSVAEILEPGEKWQWNLNGLSVTETTTFTVRGDGLSGDPPAQWSWRNDPSEETSITIIVEPPRQVPASGNLGMGIMIAALAGIMAVFIYRRTRRSNQLS